MDKLIKDAEDVSLSTSDLVKITEGKSKIILYSDLDNYKSIDDVLGDDLAVIILYQTRYDFGHWVGLTKDKNDLLTFFDPYGLSLDEELKFSTFNLRQHQGRMVPHLSALIRESGYKIIENKIQLQELLEHVNTCGRWVGLFIRMRDLGLKKFQNLFLNQKETGDYYVSAITLLF